MWSEEEVKKAHFAWKAASAALNAFKEEKDDPYTRGLADGYAGALTMILQDKD